MTTRISQEEPHVPRAVDDSATGEQRRNFIAALIARQPLAAFFVLAFVLTWAALPWNSFMAAGPLLAALVVTAVVDGRRGLRELGSRMLRCASADSGTPRQSSSHSGSRLEPGRSTSPSDLRARYFEISSSPHSPPCSQRGSCSPWARQWARSRGGAASHVPLIWVSGENLPPIFLLATFAVTFFYTWLFIHTGGSVLLTLLAHALEGTVGPEFTKSNGFLGSDKTHWTLLYTAGWCAVAIALLVFDRQLWRVGSRRQVERFEAFPSLPSTG